MKLAVAPLVSLLGAGKEAEAVEYLVSFVSGASRRGLPRVEIPADYLTGVLEERLRGMGCELRPTLGGQGRNVEIRFKPGIQNPRLP